MYARDKSFSTPLLGVLLMLCMVAVAVHFIAESLSPAVDVSSPAMRARLGLASGIHEHGEDHFVFYFVIRSLLESSSDTGVSLGLFQPFSFSLLPQLPPPNS